MKSKRKLFLDFNWCSMLCSMCHIFNISAKRIFLNRFSLTPENVWLNFYCRMAIDHYFDSFAVSMNESRFYCVQVSDEVETLFSSMRFESILISNRCMYGPSKHIRNWSIIFACRNKVKLENGTKQKGTHSETKGLGQFTILVKR